MIKTSIKKLKKEITRRIRGMSSPCSSNSSTNMGLILGKELRHTKISYLGGPSLIKKNIARLDVPVDDRSMSVVVQVEQSPGHSNNYLMSFSPVQCSPLLRI